MELSRGQQRLLFVVVVLALGGLGIFLLGSRHRTATPPPARPSATAAPATSTPASAPATTIGGGGGVNIYQWLPFTQQDLTAASRATVAFAADYENWSYTEPAQAYVAKMNGLVTTNFAASLQNSYATPGVAALRSAQKQISTSSGGIASIRSFGTGSITFVVNIAQRLATTSGTSNSTKQYAVTVVSNATGWQVNDVELAGAGNQ
ncbi:MAG: hypothetical protein WAK44_13280 [Trebonia sp.]|uniref:hypothetical protein n=1 Tax=Trebonia sp. TaxID=2767075 RepID=UPI003BAF5C09